MNSRVLVIGATGAVGQHLVSHLRSFGLDVDGASRSGASGVRVNPSSEEFTSEMAALPKYSAVVFAQGKNATDSINEFSVDVLYELIEANIVFIGRVLSELLRLDRLVDGARICVISSTWATLARQDKFSYSVTKAAVGGFIRSCSVDLAGRGMLINAVLPGPIETPMTRAMLTADQLESIIAATGRGTLVPLETVSSMVAWLVGPMNNGVTGECIHVDLGLSHVRLV